MSDDFLSRWSRLKRASTQALPAEAERVPAERSPEAPPASVSEAPPAAPAQPLPPVDSLSFDSDFTAFMKPEVDGLLRRQALKTLFQDPRFNVMDGLDVYISDFSLPDPLPEGWLEKMNQVTRLGDYRPPEEEVPAAPEPGSEPAQKPPQNEALATAAEPPPSDTLEPPAMPPQVTESGPPE